MKILLTGATGYIGKRLLPVLLKNGHEVVCIVRDKGRFENSYSNGELLQVIELDLLNPGNTQLPKDIDVAYFLVHSMTASKTNFESLEQKIASNFVELVGKTGCRQIIYLGGLVNTDKLSRHLRSRKNTEEELRRGSTPVTSLRAGIIVGSGSASFEIIRDLVEKLPVMIAPRWLNTKCQPIAIRDVITLLVAVAGNKDFFGQVYDIGGEDVLTYQEMLMKYAHVRNLKRRIFSVPVMTPRLSSYWLYFVTSVSYNLAVSLVDSMKVDVICSDRRLIKRLGLKTLSYEESVRVAFDRIRQNMVLSSWKDALISSRRDHSLDRYINVPEYGCFKDSQSVKIKNDPAQVRKNIWSVGGDRGWYYANWLWNFRGFIDLLNGGVGLRRGRTNKHDIYAGDALDFWRVLVADQDRGRLLLYAEMKLPGEAWLEFDIRNGKLIQTATFRPKGLPGRLYWYALYPMHYFIFRGMVNNMEKYRDPERSGSL